MAPSQVRLLTLASATVSMLIWSTLLLEARAGKGRRDYTPDFLEMPSDVEFTGQKEINLRCRYGEPVKKCTWRKDEYIVRFKNEMHVRFGYNESQGICDIFIRRPDMGKDTTKWKCTIERRNGEVLSTNEIVIYVKNVTRTSYYDNFFYYQLMYQTHDASNPNLTNIHLEMLAREETRIRWYVDDKEMVSLYDTKVNLRTTDSNTIYSSISLDVTTMSQHDLRVIRCCVEYKESLKTFKVFTVYLAAPWFTSVIRLSNETSLRDSYTVTPPQPVLYVDGKEVSELFLRFEIQYPTLHEVRFRCVEQDAYPSSVLMWQTLTTDTDAASDFIEFNQSQQAFEEAEVIALHAIFQHPKSHLTVACHAYNILAPKRYHRVAQIHIMLKYVAPKCPAIEGNAHSASQKNFWNSGFYLFVILILSFKNF